MLTHHNVVIAYAYISGAVGTSVIMAITHQQQIRDRQNRAPKEILQLQQRLIGLPLTTLATHLEEIRQRPWKRPSGDLCWWADLLDHLQNHLEGIIAENGVGKMPPVCLSADSAQQATSILLFISYLLDHCTNSQILCRFTAAIDLLQTANLNVLVAATGMLAKIDTSRDGCEALPLDTAVDMLNRWSLFLPLPFDAHPLQLLDFYKGDIPAEQSLSENDPLAFLHEARNNPQICRQLIELRGNSLMVLRHLEPTWDKLLCEEAILPWAALVEPAHNGVVPRPLKMLALQVIGAISSDEEYDFHSIAGQTNILGVAVYTTYFTMLIEDGELLDDEFAITLFKTVSKMVGYGIGQPSMAPILVSFIEVSRCKYPLACAAAVNLLDTLQRLVSETAHPLNELGVLPKLFEWLQSEPTAESSEDEMEGNYSLQRALLGLASNLLTATWTVVTEPLAVPAISECMRLVLQTGSASVSVLALATLTRIIRRQPPAATTIVGQADFQLVMDACMELMRSAPWHCERVLVFVTTVGASPGARRTGFNGLAFMERVFTTIPHILVDTPDVDGRTPNGRSLEEVGIQLGRIGETFYACLADMKGDAAKVLVAVISEAIAVLNQAPSSIPNGNGGYAERFVAGNSATPWDAPNRELEMAKQVLIMTLEALQRKTVIAGAFVEALVRKERNVLLDLVTHPALPYNFSTFTYTSPSDMLREDNLCSLFEMLNDSLRDRFGEERHALAGQIMRAMTANIDSLKTIISESGPSRGAHWDTNLVAHVVSNGTIPGTVKQLASLALLMRIFTAFVGSAYRSHNYRPCLIWSSEVVKFMTGYQDFFGKLLRFVIDQQAQAFVAVEADIAVSTLPVLCTSYHNNESIYSVAHSYDDWLESVRSEPRHRRAVARRVRAVRFSLWQVDAAITGVVRKLVRYTSRVCFHNSAMVCSAAVSIVTASLHEMTTNSVGVHDCANEATIDRVVMWRLANVVMEVFNQLESGWLERKLIPMVVAVKLFIQQGGVAELCHLLARALNLPSEDCLSVPMHLFVGALPTDMVVDTQIALGSTILMLQRVAIPRPEPCYQSAKEEKYAHDSAAFIFSKTPQERHSTINAKLVSNEVLVQFGKSLVDHGELFFQRLEPAALDACFLELFDRVSKLEHIDPTMSQNRFQVAAFYGKLEIVKTLQQALPRLPRDDVASTVNEALERPGKRDLWSAAEACGATLSDFPVPQSSLDEDYVFVDTPVTENVLNATDLIIKLLAKTLGTRVGVSAQMVQLYLRIREHTEEKSFALEVLKPAITQSTEPGPRSGPSLLFSAAMVFQLWRNGTDPFSLNEWFPVFARAAEIFRKGARHDIEKAEISAAASLLETLLVTRSDLLEDPQWRALCDTTMQREFLVPAMLSSDGEVSLSLARLALVMCMRDAEMAGQALSSGFIGRVGEIGLNSDTARAGSSIVGKQLETVALMLLRSTVETASTLEKLMSNAFEHALRRGSGNFKNISTEDLQIMAARSEPVLRSILSRSAIVHTPSAGGQADWGVTKHPQQSLARLVDYINVMAEENKTCRAPQPPFAIPALPKSTESAQVVATVDFLTRRLVELTRDCFDAAALAVLVEGGEHFRVSNLSVDKNWAAFRRWANHTQFYATALAEIVAISETAHLAVLASGSTEIPAEPPAVLYSICALLGFSRYDEPKETPVNKIGDSVALTVLQLLFMFSRISSASPASEATLPLMKNCTQLILRMAMNMMQYCFEIGDLTPEVTDQITDRLGSGWGGRCSGMILFMLLRLVNMMAEASNKSKWTVLSPTPIVPMLMVEMGLPQLASACAAKATVSRSIARQISFQYQQLICHVLYVDSRDFVENNSDESEPDKTEPSETTAAGYEKDPDTTFNAGTRSDSVVASALGLYDLYPKRTHLRREDSIDSWDSDHLIDPLPPIAPDLEAVDARSESDGPVPLELMIMEQVSSSTWRQNDCRTPTLFIPSFKGPAKKVPLGEFPLTQDHRLHGSSREETIAAMQALLLCDHVSRRGTPDQYEDAKQFFGDEPSLGSVFSGSSAATAWCDMILPTNILKRWETFRDMFHVPAKHYEPRTCQWLVHLSTLVKVYCKMAHQPFSESSVELLADEHAKRVQAVASEVARHAFSETLPSPKALLESETIQPFVNSICARYESGYSLRAITAPLPILLHMQMLRANVPRGIAQAFPSLDSEVTAGIADIVAVLMLGSENRLGTVPLDKLLLSSRNIAPFDIRLLRPLPHSGDAELSCRAPIRSFAASKRNFVLTKQDVATLLALPFCYADQTDISYMLQNSTLARLLAKSLADHLRAANCDGQKLVQALAADLGTHSPDITPRNLTDRSSDLDLVSALRRVSPADAMRRAQRVMTTLIFGGNYGSCMLPSRISGLFLEAQYSLVPLLDCVVPRMDMSCLIEGIQVVAEKLSMSQPNSPIPSWALLKIVDGLVKVDCTAYMFEKWINAMGYLSMFRGPKAFFDEQLVERSRNHQLRLVALLKEMCSTRSLDLLATFSARDSDQVCLVRYITAIGLRSKRTSPANASALLKQIDLLPLWAALDACLDTFEPRGSHELFLPVIQALMVATNQGDCEKMRRACSEFGQKHRGTLTSLERDIPGLKDAYSWTR